MRKVFLFATVLIILLGCDRPVVAPKSTPASTELPLLTPSPTFYAGQEPPTPFLAPTLSASQEDSVLQILKEKSCNLPCYLGVTPGKTSFDEADNILKQLGGTIWHEYENYNSSYPEMPALHLREYVLDINGSNLLIHQIVDVTGKNGKVEGVVADVFGNFQPEFYDAWARYSIENVFIDYGIPDQIFIRAGDRSYDVRVVYLGYGSIVEWSGIYPEGSSSKEICPKMTKEQGTSILIAAANTTSAFDIVPSVYEGLDHMRESISELLGISEKDFYEIILAYPLYCFTVN